MLIKTSHNQYRWAKNQYMTRRRRIEVKRTMSFLSLKGKTWLSIFAIIGITAILATFGWQARQSERVQELFQGSVEVKKAWAAQPTPTIPELAPVKERDEVIALIKKVWGKDVQMGLAIARCESGYKVAGAHIANTNQTVDEGVFSINSVHGMPDMENATANIAYAYSMFLTQGTAPWDSSRKCWDK